jgi:hypothetical protein
MRGTSWGLTATWIAESENLRMLLLRQATASSGSLPELFFSIADSSSKMAQELGPDG